MLAGCPDLLVHFVCPTVVLAGYPDDLLVSVCVASNSILMSVGCPDYWFCFTCAATTGFILCPATASVLTACFVLCPATASLCVLVILTVCFLFCAQTKEDHLQDLLEAKSLALTQADRLIAQYRSRQARHGAEVRK